MDLRANRRHLFKRRESLGNRWGRVFLAEGEQLVLEQKQSAPESTHRDHQADDLTKSALNSPKRLDALRNTGLLDSQPEEVFDRATRLVSRVLNAPVGLVSLVTAKRQFFKSLIGLSEKLDGERETDLSHSLCKHVVTRKAPLVINDARLDPLAKENAAIEDLGVIAYLGIPLYSHNGEVVGAFCAIDHKPRVWSRNDFATMQDIAEMLSREISLRALTNGI